MNRWTPEEDRIIAEERAKGFGWTKRALERLPGRSRNALAAHTSIAGAQPLGAPARAIPKRIQSTPLRKFHDPKIPDFLRDDFERWGVRG